MFRRNNYVFITQFVVGNIFVWDSQSSWHWINHYCDVYKSTVCSTVVQAKKHQILRVPLPLRWRHNDHDGVSNHQPHHCLLNCLFGRRSKKTSKLRVTGLCAGNSPGTGEFPAQMASNAENVSIWWRHHALNPSVTSKIGVKLVIMQYLEIWYYL